MRNEFDLPLKGIKVVEFANFVAAPTAGRILSDFGAEVIKIEALGGDKLRDMAQYEGIVGEEDKDPIFTATNSGKALISLDIKATEAKEALLKLLKDADVFISNVRMTSLKKLGLDYENICDEFPRLIYAHFSGYGLKGPECGKPGFDTTAYWTKNGALSTWTVADSFPIKPTLGFGDISSGSSFLSGILIALLGREKTGHGTFLSSSLLSNSVWYSSLGLISQQKNVGKPQINDPLRPSDPLCHFYKCADDKYISISDNSYDSDLEKFAHLFGIEQILQEEKFSNLTLLHETDAVKELTELLNSIFLQKSSEEWIAFLERNNVACEKILSLTELAEDPQVSANAYVEKLEFKDNLQVTMPMPPIKFNNYAMRAYSSESQIGKDTERIFKEIGYTEAEIKDLKAKNIIR